MKNYLLFILLLASVIFSSCGKAVEQQKENYVIGIMTDGRWYLENFTQNGNDSTVNFFGYEFQFYANGKVDGILNTVSQTGDWGGDVTNYTITANFATSGNPLKKLNYTWKIKDSYTNLVIAETTTATGTQTMRLKKK